ncbi:Dimethylaniline monooxygenase [Mycena sanguinolenta]|uniref:RNA-dependent RNA polymerase n=1 Tax=Mycena sanguinolenta TaxID=230812 RepID=A0A8H6XYS5_9AGAR|nr:Dimethylaniline monooxygenase [Mycena sanguinolenta]
MSRDNGFDTSMDSDSDSELWNSFESSSSEIDASCDFFSHSTRLKRRQDMSDASFDDSRPSSKKVKISDRINFITDASSSRAAEPFLIAGFNNAGDETMFNSISGLPLGVKWEIARLVSMGRLTNLMLDDLHQLKGSNAEVAPKTIETIFKEKARKINVDVAFAAERKSQCPWEELDREEAALSVDPNAALGNSPAYPERYYGGKVSFVGSIEEVGTGGKFKVVLDRCGLTSSSRLCRRFGSSAILRLKVPLKLLHSDKNLQEFFRKPFVIFGNVFRSFYAKEATVFLFKTRESYSQGKIHDSPAGLSLFEFLDEFNPLELNANQMLCKWASRFALGLSNSVPGPVLNPENVEEINDIISPANSNMTDGCGISNLAFNLKLRFDFNLQTMPCAVQVRHGGRKGMLVLWPDSTHEDTPKICFRNSSQVKINYSEEAKAHPANSTVDILRFSRTTCPARLSPEVIINLEHNGVPAEVFVRMQEAYIAHAVDDLLYWAKEPGRDTPEVMLRLWRALEKSEDVYIARRVREAVGEARFRGFGEKFNDSTVEDEEEDVDTAINERSTAWWPDYISGCPSSLAETCMTLVDSGFTPQSLPVLREKLKQIVLKKIKYRSTHFRYEVPQSASAFVVPDCWDVLHENEIHFKSSRRQFLNSEGVETDTVIGDVLMTRNPCKVPTDVRKLKAVKHEKLHDLVDVIVCTVKGQRRLLDFLGGDYDGDTAIVIWDPEIVDSFVNAPEKFSLEPQGIGSCFDRDENTVKSFNQQYAGQPPEVKAAELQKYLLGSLRDPSAVGQYSGYHDNSILTRGYDNPRTVKLAYKSGTCRILILPAANAQVRFCKILDSPKTGYNIKPETRTADAKQYGHLRGPAWKNKDKDASGVALNVPLLQRKVDPTNPSLARPFIMDVLTAAALSQKDAWLKDAEDLFRPFEERDVVLDADLQKPWRDFGNFVNEHIWDNDKRPKSDMTIIGKHVKEMSRRHSEEIKSEGFTDRAIEIRQDTLRNLSHDFAAQPTPNDLGAIFDPMLIARLRASYAYIHDYHKHEWKGSNMAWSRFPWNVALGDLCKIKTDALGPHKAITMTFYERFKLGGERR